MNWLEHITVDEKGNLFYRNRDLELTCENIFNICNQSVSGNFDREISDLAREIKIDILLSKEDRI